MITPIDVRGLIDTSLTDATIERLIAMAERMAGGLEVTAEVRADIELMLACHLVALADPPESGYRTPDGVSVTLATGTLGQGLTATTWGQQALALDVTGALASASVSRRRPTFRVVA